LNFGSAGQRAGIAKDWTEPIGHLHERARPGADADHDRQVPAAVRRRGQPPLMTEPNLLMISAAAFTAVLVLLSALAGLIQLLTTLFPADEEMDAGIVAAITAAAAQAYPGRQITRIEEER
jgi:hypothetical protein